jgi:hypothetical protein
MSAPPSFSGIAVEAFKMDESAFEWDLSGRPMAAVNNIDPSSACVKMAAVGRKFRLGQLYDYTTDAILKG